VLLGVVLLAIVGFSLAALLLAIVVAIATWVSVTRLLA